MMPRKKNICLVAALLVVFLAEAAALAETKEAVEWFEKGKGYAGQKDYDRAIESFTKAINIDPGYELVYYSRGTIYVMKGLYDRAIEDCSKSISIDSDNAAAYYNRGLAYKKKGVVDSALGDFKKVCDLGIKQGCKSYDILAKKN